MGSKLRQTSKEEGEVLPPLRLGPGENALAAPGGLRPSPLGAQPIAYLVNAEGLTAAEGAAGVEPIRGLLARIEAEGAATAAARRCPCAKVRGESGCLKRNGHAPGAKPRELEPARMPKMRA
jgi:hypothetical protein